MHEEARRPRRHQRRSRTVAEVELALEPMESQVRGLRQEVARTEDSLRAATRRCRELVRELDGLSADHERERLLRDQQLSRILRALLVLESRLKQEQKSIRQLLCEKDNVIRNQQLEIARLRRYTKSYIKGKRDQSRCTGAAEVIDKAETEDPPSFEASDFQEHDSGLSKDIQKLKCEIITKLNEGLDGESGHPSTNIRKTHSFAGSDISKTSLTSSENTDASIITTTTDGSPSLLSTEGFCEGESTDVSPGSTLNKSSSRCTPTIVMTDSETEVTMVILDERQKTIARSESKDDGLDCNYASDEDEPIYENARCDENNARNIIAGVNANAITDDRSNNNVEMRLTRIEPDEQSHEESSGNWYSDPDEDRLNDEMLRHSVYRPNSNHNSVLECVNQILLRDMEDEENNILSVPRRFKHRGKIVRFQPARLSDIESVGSEMERRNSDESPQTTMISSSAETTSAAAPLDRMDKKQSDGKGKETEPLSDGFEATNSEDEFGMRIQPALDPESRLEEDANETKPRPIIIIEPFVNVEEPMNDAGLTTLTKKSRSERPTTSPTSLRMERIEEKSCLQMSGCKGLTIAKNLDYEDIESLPEVIGPQHPKIPPALPPKPQFRNNTLVLKKIPSPSFLIDETSHKKQVAAEAGQATTSHRSTAGGVHGIGGNLLPTSASRSLKFDEVGRRCDDTTMSFWRSRFNNVRSSFRLKQQQNTNNGDVSASPELLPKVTSIVRHFEEFKIEDKDVPRKQQQQQQQQQHFEIDDYDIQQNFEEFNLDECDLSDDPDRPGVEGSESFGTANNPINDNSPPPGRAGETTTAVSSDNNNAPTASTAQLTNGNSGNSGNGHYDSFLEATGLSNKSILTPSRLLSNHKSMLKPKDVKYKSKIKATAVMERHGVGGNGVHATTTHTKHWTGPFV
ncbi:PREDICTED: uncharacterized protein LOC105368518 [Ceratosolen solmsi marchali]|uniref:Uncharacterized protein LOC105368518 n=1 Tax=Ceratosolen solmsi marchali TaxID=326594 RepID=A0AAJ6YWU7_9HYME|nr:PREDICTED: uncharacterized protein LOC105368518 [Ceratosolen solmsi marchali]